MQIEQLYTNCLAQGAYFIASNGEAAVIDPLRETAAYLNLAVKAGAKIKYIFETHFHADFVSGHLDLAAATGARIIYGPGANTGFSAYIGKDSEVFTLGDLKITLLHTPGHTPESSCYLLEGPDNSPATLFTGDTLFIGDVGRPDLAQETVRGLTKEDLAGMLYDSLREKIMPLPDNTIIYPAHGAGSACGKNMSKATFDTLGNQKQFNYALDPNLSRDSFIKGIVADLPPAPAYFPFNAKLNSQGYEHMDSVLTRGMNPLSPTGFQERLNRAGVLILDSRDPEIFTKGYIPGAVNISLNGSFAPWVGALLPHDTPILLVTEIGKEQETIIRLGRIGYDKIVGYLQGGIKAWIEKGFYTANIPCISVTDFYALFNDSTKAIDVRNSIEFDQGHLPGALQSSLNLFSNTEIVLDKKTPHYVYCAGGYRSVIYISLLKSKTDVNLINIDGGFNKLREFQNSTRQL